MWLDAAVALLITLKLRVRATSVIMKFEILNSETTARH